MADVSEIVLDRTCPDEALRAKIYLHIARESLEAALQEVRTLARPENDVYFRELETHYRSVRRFFPSLLKSIQWESNPAGQPIITALRWLETNEPHAKSIEHASRDIIDEAWQLHVIRSDDTLDHRAYTFCVLDALHTALRKRDVFVTTSWRYADPRAGLLAGPSWVAARPQPSAGH